MDGPGFDPAIGEPDSTRIGRLESWAVRHEEWSRAAAHALHEESTSQCERIDRLARSHGNRIRANEAVVAEVREHVRALRRIEERVDELEDDMQRALAQIGRHTLKWQAALYVLGAIVYAVVAKLIG
jgi:seryl-tRNA synthetase